MLLLTADWHLTDNPADEYRWAVFAECRRILASMPTDTELFVIGDICDRKDRHSGKLVNRIVHEFGQIAAMGRAVTVSMGNHDMPLNGPPFWQFLNDCFVGVNGANAVAFVTEPLALGDLLVLPYAANPKEAWTNIDFNLYKSAFIHQTVTGVKENGITLENEHMPTLPKKLKVYSGDIHTPQVVGNVTYVGAPHPVKFGDDYYCRMLVLDDDYNIAQTLMLHPMQKLMIDITTVAELDRVKTRVGDQACIRLALSLAQIERWPIEEEAIMRWAVERGVKVVACEVNVEAAVATADAPEEFDLKPADVLTLFADAEELADSLRACGLALLEELQHG